MVNPMVMVDILTAWDGFKKVILMSMGILMDGGGQLITMVLCGLVGGKMVSYGGILESLTKMVPLKKKVGLKEIKRKAHLKKIHPNTNSGK